MSVATLPSAHGKRLEDRTFRRSLMVSVVIHILVFGVVGSMTLFRMNGIRYAPSYTVDLVTLPGPPAPAPPATKASAPASPAPKEPAPPKIVKPEKPEPPVKKPEKKVTAPPAAAPAEPVKRVEPVKPSGGDEAAQMERRRRIEELEQEARRLYDSFTADSSDSEEPVADSTGPTVTGDARPEAVTGPGKPKGGASGGGQAGGAADLRFRAYYDEIWRLIRSSWVLPEGVATEDRLLTVVGIHISPDGSIERYWIEKKSGNEYYDQSALRAIRKSSPLPRLPGELSNEPLEVGINFRYPQ